VPQTVFTSFSVNSCDAQRKRMGSKNKTSTGFIAISRSRAAELEEEKRFGGVKRHAEEPSFNEQHRGVTRRETK
jgi:hypothetical protein